jgi:hypothetical protein
MANAALDAILMPDWEHRYFSFNSRWDDGEQMASLRDGSGGHHFVLFCEKGAFVKGFDVGSPLNAPLQSVADDWRTSEVPIGLGMALSEPAFEMENLSFCLWSMSWDDVWHAGKPPSEELLDVPLGRLHLLVDEPEGYAAWASEYYERSVPTEMVRRFYRLEPLDDHMVRALNDSLQLEDVADDLEEAGYPLA